MRQDVGEVPAGEWVSFPGGELEGKRPKTLCAPCREALEREAAPASSRRAPRPLCFQCYRAGLDRERNLRAAGQLFTGSDERFQAQLPFEPVNRPRLEMLKAERATTRAAESLGAGQYVAQRRHAQIAARHALQAIASGLKARVLAPADRDRVLANVVHAAELQLPEAWLPFVVAR
jgi:hypothetical protein